MKTLSLILACFTFYIASHAQIISGTVFNDLKEPLENVSVNLIRQKDSSLIKVALTNTKGNYYFNFQDSGQFYLQYSYVNYNSFKSASFLLTAQKIQMAEVTMMPLSKQLSSVEIQARRPFVEVINGITIVNVEGTINATGTDVLELLRKSPGVTVDKDNNIGLQGKNGVQIFIDGKQSPLSGEDLSNYLMSLQSSLVDYFEIITTPSAKYDAAGNAGIINIKLKKNKSFGTNGSVSLGFNQGKYSKYNSTVSLNHRNKIANFFASYNLNTGKNFSDMNFYREISDSSFKQYNTFISKNTVHNYKFGTDFFLNKNSTLGFIISGNIADVALKSEAPIEIKYLPTQVLERRVLANNNRNSNRNSNNINLNYLYQNSKKQKFSIDADKGKFDINTDQFQPNIYYDAVADTLLFNNTYKIISPTNIDLYSVKLDAGMPFKKGQFEFGTKLASVRTKNNYERYNVFANVPDFDEAKSNQFNYKENILAAYASMSYPFKKVSLQMGLRVENTQSKSRSIGQIYDAGSASFSPYDSTNKKSYTDLFPSLGASFKITETKALNFSYSRRIDRPAYQDLNPFEFRISDYIYAKGNTELRPQYSNSFGLQYTFFKKLNTALNYTHVKDIFTQLPDTTESSKSFLIKKNLATQDVVGLSLNLPYNKAWYNLNVNVFSNYSIYKANFGGGDRKINLSAFNYAISLQQGFKLGKGYTAELNAMYNAPSIWQGTYKMKSLYGLDAGLQKNLFQNKATLKLSVTDIFKTMGWSGESHFTGAYNKASGNWESRQLRLSFVYRFGKNLLKSLRLNKTSSDEESKRVNGSDGLGGM